MKNHNLKETKNEIMMCLSAFVAGRQCTNIYRCLWCYVFRQFKLPLARHSELLRWSGSLRKSSRDSCEKDWHRYQIINSAI